MTPSAPHVLRIGAASHLRRLSAAVTLLTFFSYIAALLRERATAAAYGASRELDTFVVANTAIAFISLTVGRALYDPVVVTLASSRERDPQSARALARFVILAMSGMLVGGAALLVLVRHSAVTLIAPAMPVDALGEAARLTLLLSPAVALLGLGEITRAILHGYQEFLVSSLLPVTNTMIVLGAVVLLAPTLGIEALVLGTVIGGAAQLVLAVGALLRVGALTSSGGAPAVEQFRAIAAPLAAGLALTALSSLLVVVDRALGSLLPEGRIAALNYAGRILDVATAITVSGIAAVAYPLLARLRAANRMSEFERVFWLSFAGAAAIAVPLGLALAVLAIPAVTVLFGVGRFDATAQRVTGESLAAYALALPFLAPATIVARTLYALRRVRLLIAQAGLFLAVKIIMGLVLVGPFEHVGVALATTLAAAVVAAVTITAIIREMRLSRRFRATASPGA